jgi:hypothetical protein
MTDDVPVNLMEEENGHASALDIFIKDMGRG